MRRSDVESLAKLKTGKIDTCYAGMLDKSSKVNSNCSRPSDPDTYKREQQAQVNQKVNTEYLTGNFALYYFEQEENS